MRKLNLSLLTLALALGFLASCSKKNSDNSHISTPPLQIGQAVSDASPLSGSIKGTMLSGKTYTIGGDVTVNAGDTLLLQNNVRVNVTNGAGITVKGVLISLGTKDNPNWFTAPNVTKQDAPGIDPASDPAYQGLWQGINCDTTCPLLVIKWTHIEYTGGVMQNPSLPGYKSGDNSYSIYFENPKGIFVLEDSWLYGCIDDAVRIAGGKISIMRNTVEKSGYTGGDVFNAKSGTTGDMAYNLFIGCATNGTKASNKGGLNPQTTINMYNNTYIDCGYRRSSAGRGADINYEEGSKGSAYNNLIVNCKYGLRIVNNPAADTANMHYGNTFNYGDSINIVDQFYPQGYITKPQPTDIPAPSSFLPTGYNLGDAYNAPSLVGQNNPQFVNFPLPAPGVVNYSYTAGFDFHLKSTSPAIGKGFTGFSPVGSVPVDAVYGATELTTPGSDIGCYQTNGKGNQH